MAAQQILVLFVQVRVLVEQQKSLILSGFFVLLSYRIFCVYPLPYNFRKFTMVIINIV